MSDADNAKARAVHHRDQYDAEHVERLRQLGRDIEQPKTYERRAQAYLRDQGY